MTFQPLDLVASFLQDCEKGGVRATLAQGEQGATYAASDDKLAQLEYYHAREGAAFGQHC